MLAHERDAYLAHVTVEKGLSVHTVAAYRRDLSRYSAFLDSRGRAGLAEVTRADVADFSQAIGTGADGGRPLAPASASRTVVAVRGWHRFAVAEGWTGDDVSLEVKPRAIPKRLPKAISTDDVARILAEASREGEAGLRDRALLELVYASGARISEATGLDVDDVTLVPGEAAVLLRGKGRKERVVPIGGYAADALDAYLVRARSALAQGGRGTPALFLNTRGGRLSRQSAWAILKSAADRAQVPDVSPHTLRHSFATHLLAGGADVRVVQELLGHASVTTTQIYTAVTQDALREVYVAAHPRAR
ncbi:site-specific tyrosine recombinase XerD [Demequina sp. NBRC 110056]|uniref:site-specific tyrosine recombinase XerD n=1 Tax=Demequina sp. NBRC 110056 TaxID=1570345 RepID=UPI000A032503|nr:site-specific tyrosine recombinase XerD [Demequina sp. NBRC 110056]